MYLSQILIDKKTNTEHI